VRTKLIRCWFVVSDLTSIGILHGELVPSARMIMCVALPPHSTPRRMTSKGPEITYLCTLVLSGGPLPIIRIRTVHFLSPIKLASLPFGIAAVEGFQVLLET
jgi:hypothetical protein